MRPVQFILILLVLGILVLYFNRLRSGVLDRVAVVAFGILGLVMVAVPDVTTRAAHAVGVGRGADLFIYLSLLGIAFICLLLYSKIRDLETTITDLTRSIAIERAAEPREGSKDS
jgi:hypothetical protein